MTHLMWLTVWLFPAAAATVAMTRRAAVGRALLLAAPLPAAGVALSPIQPAPVEIEWLLLGTRFGLDAGARVLLAMTAVLWAAAAWYGRTYMRHARGRRAYWGMFGLCMSGNFGLIIAQDLVTFYMAFAMMTLAAYALVMHRNDTEARLAGRVYIIMAICGEVVLVAGLMLASHAAGGWSLEDLPAAVAASEHRDLIAALIFVGFGVKAGVLGLHMWLPLAHPAAPTPASAVLSGTMIKAGLLGWLRVLPLGEAAMPEAGAVVMTVGLLGAFFAVAVGVMQTNAKTVLAYSSVSQMGLMVLMVGMAIGDTEAWGLASAGIIVYALHHGLAKGALFLGVGVAQARRDRAWQRGALIVGLVLAAAALAGAPMTSGQIAKHAMKQIITVIDPAWYRLLDVLLPVSATATTLLMARFLWLTWPREHPATRHERAGVAGESGGAAGTPGDHPAGPGMWWTWLAVIGIMAVATWWAPRYMGLAPAELTPWAPAELWHAMMPMATGALIAVFAALFGPSMARPWVPAGDVVWGLQWLLGMAAHGWRIGIAPAWHAVAQRSVARWNRVMLIVAHTTARLELRLIRWATAGTIFVLVLIALALAAQWRS